MAGYDLPTSLEIGGRTYEIRSDYRAVLDVMRVMADPEITDGERIATALAVFYPDGDDIPTKDLQEAVDRMYQFVNAGEPVAKGPRPRLMDWDQDFPLIVAPVNHVLGYEARAVEYLHWWTFLAAYREIGDCTFAQVVGIRKKQARGKKLDKQDAQFYRENRELVDLKRVRTEQEAKLFDAWIN